MTTKQIMEDNKKLARSMATLMRDKTELQAEVRRWKTSTYEMQLSEAEFAEEARVKSLRVHELEAEVSQKEYFRQNLASQRERLIKERDLLRDNLERAPESLSEFEREQWKSRLTASRNAIAAFRSQWERMRRDMDDISFVKTRLQFLEAKASPPVWHTLASGLFTIPDGQYHVHEGSLKGLSGVVSISLQDVEARILKEVTKAKEEILNIVAWRTRHCLDPEKQLTKKKRK